MAIICPRCRHQYDITLFQFGSVVQCDCGVRIKLDPGKGIILEEENISHRRRPTMSIPFVSGPEATPRIKNLVHRDTQVKEGKVYLTVKQVYLSDEKGSVDFSGKELAVAKRKPVLPEKKFPEDKFGWWRLGKGTYLIQFNEQIELKEKEIAILQPREELLQNFCFHPTRIMTPPETLPPIPLSAGGKGIDAKQNAHLSVLKIVRT